ncbi:hypothetical protein F5Y18DRAFT_436907 [Xylariaceae sp. FL1019]|nr:hypothetical protein F5Y18DRAFT_436907 [Xylariaceae sp. FL1019]
MKIITRVGEQLKCAQKRIEELKAENQKLKIENRQLRLTSPKHVTFSSSRRIVQPPTSTVPSHAQPTASSLAKHESTKDRTKSIQSANSVLTIGDGKYRYKDGVPIKVARNTEDDGTGDWVLPWLNYMGPTNASYRKASETRTNTYEWKANKKRLSEQRVDYDPPPSPQPPQSPEPSLWSWPQDSTAYLSDCELVAETEVEGNEMDLRFQEEERLRLEGEMLRSQYNVPNLDVFSRLDENWNKNETFSSLDFPDHIKIDSATGLRLLRQAMALVQETMSPLFRKHCWTFKDSAGPHLLRLGWLELKRYITEDWPSWLAMNGHNAYDVQSAILDLPELRNAVCHPEEWKLCSPAELDRYLKLAQRVAFIFRDWDRTMVLRKLRDKVVAEMSASDKQFGNICGLAAIPFSENMDLEQHFRDIFGSPLTSWRPENMVVIESAQALRANGTLRHIEIVDKYS